MQSEDDIVNEYMNEYMMRETCDLLLLITDKRQKDPDTGHLQVKLEPFVIP